MRKRFTDLFIRILQAGLISFFVFSFASCGEDSGLGGAIDTKAPSLSIDYPKESGSAIRDTFILAGSVADDKSISRVTVSIKSLDDGGKISETYAADFDLSENRWWIDINSHDDSNEAYHNGWQYPDGNYEFSVTAFDNAGNNSGTYSKTFEIDNTPPLFIISNPGVIKKTGLSPSAYGSIFTIDGTISDNHTISFMDVKIFDASGNCVSSESYEGENIPFYREEDIATAGGTSVQIAQYGNSAVNSRYSQLHASDTGTEYYYAQITLTDSTKVYRDPWADSARSAVDSKEDSLGNSTSAVYLYDDVYSSLMSAKKGLGLSAANLKDIISGVYDGEQDRDSVLSVLNSKKYDTSADDASDPMGNKLSFSLNPEANPTYNVNGFEFGFKKEDTVQTASTGNTVSVTISAGLDGTNIAPENVRVWMKTYSSRPAESDEDAIKADLNSLEKAVEGLERTETDFMDTIHETPETPATSVTTGGASWILVYDYSLNNSKGSSVSTKTFSVTLPGGIELSKYYILGVTGYDIEDVEFSQRKVYGFEGNTAGVPPTLNFVEPANLSVWKNFTEPKFSGTAVISSKSLYITELGVSLTLTDEGSNTVLHEPFSDTITCKIENDEKVWTLSDAQALTWDSSTDTWTLDAMKLPGLEEYYNENSSKDGGVYWLATLKITGKSSSGHEGESTQSIHIDTVSPVITLSSVTPSVSGSDYFGGSDTNTYLNGIVTIKGNIEEQYLKDEDDAVTYDVLASVGDSAPASILSQLIERKDELGVDFDGKLGKIFSLNIPFDTKAITKFYGGDPKIQIEVLVTATDKAGNTNTVSSKTLNGGKNFVIYQETDRPQIKLGNADETIRSADGVKINHNLFGTTSNNQLQITFSDDDEIAEYELTVFDENGIKLDNSKIKHQEEGSIVANPYKYNPGKTTATLNYTLPAEEAKYQILIKARDKLSTDLNQESYGKKTVGNFFVAVDSGKPDIEIATPGAGSFQNKNVTVTGSISKKVDLSGKLYKDGVEVTGEAGKGFSISKDALIQDPATELYSWETSTAEANSDGAYTITVSATDQYDQYAEKSRVFKVDTQAPAINKVTTSVDSSTIKLVPLDEMEYVTLGATVSDGDPSKVAGISVVKYYLSKTEVELDKTSFESTDSDSGWTQMNQGSTDISNVTSFNASVAIKKFAEEQSIADGNVYVYVAAKDNAGNFNIVSSPVTLTLDKTAPKIKIMNFAGDTEIEANGISTTKEPSARFNVVVEDSNVASLVSADNSIVAVVSETAFTGGKSYSAKPSWTEVSGISGKYEDSKNVTFTAKDANSRTAAKTITIKCDNYAPRVTLTRSTGDNFSSSNSIELKGEVKDANISGSAEYLKVYLVPVSSSAEVKEGAVTFTKSTDGYTYTANFSGLQDVEYNIAIVAKDSFGNISKWSTDSSKTTAQTGSDTTVVTKLDDGSISIDSLAPTSTVALTSTGKVLDRSKVEISAGSPYALDFGYTYYTDKKFTLGGIITETNLVKNASDVVTGTAIPKLTCVKEVGATQTDLGSLRFTLGNNDGSGKYTWSYEANYAEDGSADGLYQYTLTLWDKSKQQFSKTVTVVVDTTKPELSFTSPSEGENFTSAPSIKIAYSDDGTGVNKESAGIIKIYNITDTATLSDTNLITASTSTYELTAGSATATATFANGYNSEGSFKVVAQVEDYLGRKADEQTRTFYYDINKPELTANITVGSITSNAESGLTTNGGTDKKFTLSGTVSDTNALYNNGIADSNGKTAITITATVGGTEKSWYVPVTGVTDKKSGNWSKEFSVGSGSGDDFIPDGTYTFAIIATDVAKKTTQKSSTVRVDTVAPDLGTPAVTTTKATKTVGTTTEDWYKTDSLRFEGTASDSGTGIASVSYQTSENGTTWTPAAPLSGTTSWSGTISGIKSKTTIVKIIVADNAGNTKESVGLGPWKIDTTEPKLTAGSVKADSNAVSEESPYYSRGNKPGNPSPAATVTFKVEDETNGSGIKNVDVQIYSKATDSTTAIHANLATDGSGSCTATIPATSITKSGTVYARIYDYAGNYSDVNLFALTYDATDPVIQSATLKDSSDYTAYKPNQDVEKYYVNNTDGNFTLSGIATDNLGLKSAKLELKEGDVVKKTYEITDETKLSDWKFEIGSDLSTLSLTATETSPLTAALTVSDKAGNKATKDIAIVFDTVTPAALHVFDSGSPSKDSVFRIGEDDNDLAELKAWTSTITALDSSKDKDVGGKYAPGTYGKANTITVRGYFTEEGSGLQYVYYKVFSQSTAPTADQINTFVSNYKTEKTGFFSAIAEDTKRVKFNTSTTAYEFRDIKTNFKSTISEFGIGKNYLVLVGVDYVGNAAVDGISYTPTGSSTSLNCYSINVDVEAPTVERVLADGESSTLLTNASSADLVLNGTAFDNPSADSYANASGIKSLSASIKVKEKTGTEKEYKTTDSEPQISIVPSDNNTKWTVTVKKEIFENVDAGNFSVYVTATDNAGTGNSQTANVGTITVDKIQPTVTLALPTDADTSTAAREINGIIDLSGTVKDANPLPETSIVAIQYIKKADYTETDDSESAGTKWVTLTNTAKGEMENLDLSGDYTFDIKNFDTTKIEPLNDVVYYIRAKAVDKAGNVGYSPIKDSNGNFIEITISQDSDRPVVNITNLTDLGAGATPRFVLKYGTKSQVIATVSDDDGIDKVYLSEAEYKGTFGETAPSAVMSAYSETNGTVTFTPQADITAGKNVDESKSFYIYVKDKAGKVFYTTYYATAADALSAKYLNSPKLKFGSFHENTSDIQKFTYQSDSTSPVVEDIQALAYKSDGTTKNGGAVVTGTGATATTAYTAFESVNASYIIGGTEKQKTQFKITASDASSIDGIALEISYTEVEGTTETPKTLKYRSKNDVAIADSTYTVNGTLVTDSTDATKSTWTTGIIDFSKAKTGSVSVKVIPYDKLGLVGNGNATFVVDNSAPPINITAPASGAEKTGAVSIVGTSYDDNAGTANIQWIIPTRDDVTAANATSSESARFEYLKNLKVTVDGTEKSKWNGGTASLASGTSVSVSSWQFDFDGSYDSTKSNASNFIFASGNPKFDLYDSATFASSINDGVYTIPIYFMATDSLGNYTIKEDYVICHNPDGDRPKVEFTYPTTKDYDKNSSGTSLGYATLGGTIRVTGSAEIPSNTTTVKNVYLQIADSSAGFTGTAAASTSGTDSYKAKTTYGYTIVSAYEVINEIKGTSYNSESTFTDAELKALGFSTKTDLDNWWGIKTNGTASWNIALNDDGKMNPTGDGTNDIAIRACGVNAEGKFGAWTQGDNLIAIHVDNKAPTVTYEVNQYSSDVTTANASTSLTARVTQSYEPDMFLRGQWYLVLDILDESGIGSLTVRNNGRELTKGTDYFEVALSQTSPAKTGFKIFVKIDKTATSETYTVTAVDKDTGSSPHTTTQTFSFNIDNTAPSMESITANGAAFSSDNLVQNTNFKFTLAGKSTDEGSGVDRVVFYYMRKNGVTKNGETAITIASADEVILDPMIAPTGSNYSAAKVSMNDTANIELLEIKQPKESGGEDTYNLYAQKISGTATTTTFTGTFNDHVRVGGLVTFDKTIYRRITVVDSGSVTFEPALTTAPSGTVTAYFPIAQVIDNSATEKTLSDSANPFTFEKGDDGDKMPESFSKSGKTWTWDASIHSDNLPDGPISLVILAFDEAGNVNGTTVNTFVSNNAPRVAKLYLSTDLSGDGKFVNTDSLQEIVEYNILAAEGKEQSAYELDFTAKDEKGRAKYSNGIFTIKSGLAVIPELTGGNGNIGMVLNASATNTAKTTGTTSAGTLISSAATGVTTTTTDEDTGVVDVSVSFTGDKVNGTFTGSDPTYRMQAFVIPSNKLGDDGNERGMSFTFWDSTEETVQGSTSQYSVLYVKNFKVAQTDSVAPTVVVNPFWWNSLTDNSVYGSASAAKFTDLKGHIELEKDLVITKTDGTKVDTTLKTRLGGDPKVSGKITVTGTVYDNTRLASLKVQFGSYKTVAAAATYNSSTSSWTVPETTLADDGYIFSVSDIQKDSRGNTKYYGNWEEEVYFSQKGHKIYWTLSLDTEKLLGTTAVAENVSLSVTATDAAGKTTASTVTNPTEDDEGKRVVTDGTTNVPTYQMDVVPYVVKVTTALSKKKKSNPSVANRTALGHYPVQSVVTNMDSAMNNTTSETVTLEGFNLKHTSVAVTGGTSISSSASSATEMSKIMFNVASLASGEMTATVNSIPVINNLNNNDASGDSKEAGTNNSNWYNRIGNGDNNNTLTDDVIFDVWEFNDKAAVPFSGTVGGTKMKINQVSGQPNFAFTNGNLWWNMGGKVNATGKPSGDFSSYYWSGGYDCLATVTVGFHVDEMGYTYGSGAGGDSNTQTPPAIDSYTMWVQRWGLGSQDARSTYGASAGEVQNGAALEKVGQKETVNGVVKYSMNKQRIQSPEFTSAKNGTNTNLYHAYYDAMNDEIRFKAGTITGRKNNSTGQFVDQYCSKNGESAQDYNIDNVQVVASRSISGRGPGKYLGLAVAKNGTTDVVVMVWYDAYENQLLYSYKVNPIANLNSKDATAANWSAPKTIFDEGGEWCQIAVDAKNHIHIAAFAGDGDLKYAYLESYSTAEADIKTCTVDADGTVGEHLTLDVALDADGNSIPYIGYYSSTHKKPKYAYLVDTSAPAPAGVDESDMFTGAWEVTVVPCYSNMVVNQEEKINVGVWKYTADTTTDGVTYKKGQIKNSATGRSSYYSATGNSLYNGTNWSKTYGNGTQNGILAYQVQDGSGSCVETAQMR